MFTGRQRDARRAGSRPSAFTLIEMMVTIMVLGMIIASFSTVMVQCNRVVSQAQTIMRGTSKIAAIAQIMRNDVRRITKGGILAVSSSGGSPVLILTTSEPMTTMKSATDCLGSFVVYSMWPNLSPSANVNVKGSNLLTNILVRAEFGFPVDARLPPLDVAKVRPSAGDSGVLATVQAYTHDSPDLTQTLNDLVALYGVDTSFYMPPETLEQIASIWPVLTEGVTELAIKWSDGSKDSMGGLVWSTNNMVWTSEDAGNWPKAILFSFRLTDPHLPEGMFGTVYEVVCELAP